MARHNAMRNAIFEFCKRALLNPKLEAGAGLGHERRLTRPADILIPSWSNSDKPPAAIDVSITSLLTFCLKWVWWQVQQQGKQKRESTHAMIRSAPKDGSVYHWWWKRLVLGEELQASF